VPDVSSRFSIRSQISMAVYPKGDRPYMFGLHQCSYARVWTAQEERLFQVIGRRLEDALTSLLIFRNLRQSEARLEEAQRIAHVGYWERDLLTNGVTWSDETYRIFGLLRQNRFDFRDFQKLIHPEDREMVVRASAEAERGDSRYDVEYRVARPDGGTRIVHSEGDVRRDESGRPQRIFGTVQDITERKRAEAEVRERAAVPLHLRIRRGIDLGGRFFAGEGCGRRVEGRRRVRCPRVLCRSSRIRRAGRRDGQDRRRQRRDSPVVGGAEQGGSARLRSQRALA
jgi:PAS domain S-box-containing protein